MVKNPFDEEYNRIVIKVLTEGEIRFDKRTGQTTLGLLGEKAHFIITEYFPLLTTKKIFFKGVVEELFWKLRGEKNSYELHKRGINIWDRNAFDLYLKRVKSNLKDKKNTEEWEKEFENYFKKMDNENFNPDDSDLGPIYGYQLRHWQKKEGGEIDQLKKLIDNIKKNPGGRYAFMNSLNIGELEKMAIAPCPFHHQFAVYGGYLDSVCAQRSCDLYLGVPFNIAQEALLNILISRETNLKPRKLSHHFFDLHVYIGNKPRSEFLTDKKNLKEFQKKIKKINIYEKEKYYLLKEWYLNNAPKETKENERKDHIPFLLEQLAKEPKEPPKLFIKSSETIFEVIKKPYDQVIELINYFPHEWDSKAKMAA
ncbi:MAG: thymidylate synthase [Candidatus Pacearchaeota archaeon]